MKDDTSKRSSLTFNIDSSFLILIGKSCSLSVEESVFQGLKKKEGYFRFRNSISPFGVSARGVQVRSPFLSFVLLLFVFSCWIWLYGVSTVFHQLHFVCERALRKS